MDKEDELTEDIKIDSLEYSLVSMRDYFETMENKFNSIYFNVAKHDNDYFGTITFPDSTISKHFVLKNRLKREVDILDSLKTKANDQATLYRVLYYLNANTNKRSHIGNTERYLEKESLSEFQINFEKYLNN
jgi:hypothetical protein